MFQALRFGSKADMCSARAHVCYGPEAGRPAQPEEIAPAFVFLAAPCCSSYITGEILPIIGGYSSG